MVLDCEFNQPSRKTIQIGAAIYDVRSGACHDHLDLYVNPYEPITPEITHLTGITDKHVEKAPDIIEAWQILKEFHKKHKCFRNPLVWGSGVRNDSSALHEEYNAFQHLQDANWRTEENFMGFRVVDAKTLYQSLMLFENRGYAGGLKESMKKLGLEFEGTAHNALTDARNTWKIWYYLTRLAHDGLKAK
jgi:inhibitor of KinA sporulation pathway (predicted exonuclease)